MLQGTSRAPKKLENELEKRRKNGAEFLLKVGGCRTGVPPNEVAVSETGSPKSLRPPHCAPPKAQLCK